MHDSLAMESDIPWEQVRAGIEAEIGMDLAGSRFPRLREAVRKVLSGQKPGARLERLLSRPEERGAFVERVTAELTVGETYFFRNEHHFRALAEQVFPALIEENTARREIRVWSAGCATGEEAYSLAILFDQLLAGRGAWQVTILGTDLNREFLDRARQACYRAWSFRHSNIQHDERYFARDGDSFRLVPRLRERVRFSYLNLVKDVYPSPLTGTLGLDLIVFRNVAIYLKLEVTKAIIERFHQALRPGGWLLLGEAEVSLTPQEGFAVRRVDQATFYQKTVSRDSTSADHAPPPPVLASLPPPGPLPPWAPLPERRTASIDAAGAGRAEEPDAPSERVERLAAAGDFDEAERVLERVASRTRRASLRLRYAQALLTCAETRRARGMVDACLKDEPLLVEAQLLKASLAEEAGDAAAAEQACRRALYIDRNCCLAHFHLALLQRQNGDMAGAARSLKTTLALIERRDSHTLVEHGEGVCYGRLKEMALLLL
jgi:chemotaxis protein methyltransferase CheR